MFSVKRLLIVGITIALAVGLAACGSTSPSKAPHIVPTPAPAASRPQPDFPDEGATTTTTPKITVAHYQVGQTANLAVVDAPVGEVGAVAPRFAIDPTRPTIGRIQVSRVKFSTGSEFDHPERGLYLGAYVRALSITGTKVPGGLSWDLYAVVNHHHYDSTISAEGFDPEYGGAYLRPGEADEGWFVFDVPARHGQIVMIDQSSDEQVATWSF